LPVATVLNKLIKRIDTKYFETVVLKFNKSTRIGDYKSVLKNFYNDVIMMCDIKLEFLSKN